MSNLIQKLKKQKAFSEMILKEVNTKNEYYNTNVVSLNLVFSGKIDGGIKKGKTTCVAAESQQGKSLMGYNLLQTAFKSGMECVVIDTERAFNHELAIQLGIDLDKIAVFETSRIPDVKRIFAQLNSGLTKEESKNVFVLLDSWGALITEHVMDKAETGSAAADMGRTAQFKNELANVINAYGNTVFIINHVYASMQMYGERFEIPGGKRLTFISDSIGMCSSAAKYKDTDGNILGKVITIVVKKGRGAKEFVKAKFLIRFDGGLDPFFGLLDEALESGCVFKPKNGYYSRTDYDVDKSTGEVTKMWKEAALYNGQFWVPLYKDEKFIEYLEERFSFENVKLIASQQNVADMISGAVPLSDDVLINPEQTTEEKPKKKKK